MRLERVVAVAAFGATLTACATAAAPPAAILEFAGPGCSATPDLTQAISLTPDKERALHVVTTQVGTATPCVTLNGRPSSYLVYSIPTDFEDKTLTVGGYLEPLRILSPMVTVLDAAGEATRRFAPDEFMYRGYNYSVLFRPRADERFVLVSVDPDRVGKSYDSIVIGTSTTASGAPVASALAAGLVGGGNIRVGVDAGVSRTFSYEGAVQVAVNDSDIREAASD